jgi:acetyl-CoA carboxylase carboxyl transferase subunit beta
MIGLPLIAISLGLPTEQASLFIGFAGARVIQETIREKLPEGFQTSEYLLQHGFVDVIVPRTQLKRTLANLISIHQPFFPIGTGSA